MNLKMMPGGDTVDYDALTTSAEDVLEGKQFIGSGDEDAQTGTMVDRRNLDGSPGFSADRPNVPIHQSVDVKTTTDTNGDKQIALAPPVGRFPGNNTAYVGVYPEELGIEEDAIANGREMAGVTGTYGDDSTVSAADVRDGKVYYDKNGRQIGEAGDYAAAAATLKCGEVHNILKGFHQAGKVIAASLSSQTQPQSSDAAAAAAQILEGYGAWSNGAYRSGSMPDKGNTEASGCTADESSQTLRFTVPETGRYTSGNFLSRTFAQVREALGIVASVIKNGTTIAGLKGTYGSDATAAANQILINKTAYGKDGKITGTMALSAGVIKKGVTLADFTGTWYGNKTAIKALAVRGFGAPDSASIPSGEATFTIPENGVVYYGGISATFYGQGNGLCRILKNGAVVDERNLTGNSFVWRDSMVNKSFSANAGDVITVQCTVDGGSATLCFMQAVIVY